MCDHVLDRQLSRGMFASDFGDSLRKHPTELARGRLENPPSKLEIQRATAILQVAPMFEYIKFEFIQRNVFLRRRNMILSIRKEPGDRGCDQGRKHRNG